MNSKLGEGEGAGWRRCSKLGAELREGWLLGADGGRAGAGACASCAVAAPAPALCSWGAQPLVGAHGGHNTLCPLSKEGEQENLDGPGRMPGHPGQLQAGLRWHKGDLWSPSAQLLALGSPQRHLTPWHSDRHCIPCLPQAGRRRTWGDPPRPQAALCTHKAGLILLFPCALTLKKLLPPQCTLQDAHHQLPSARPGTQLGSDGSWQIWAGTCPTFREQSG